MTTALEKVSILVSADVKRSVLTKAIETYLPKQPKLAQELLIHLISLSNSPVTLASVRAIFNAYLEGKLLPDAFAFLDCAEVRTFLDHYEETHTVLRLQILTIAIKKPLPQPSHNLRACLNTGVLLWPQELIDAIQIHGHHLLHEETLRELFLDLLRTASEGRFLPYLSWLLARKVIETIPIDLAREAFQLYLDEKRPVEAVEVYKKPPRIPF